MEQKQIALLNMLLASWFMQETIDELKDTSAYNRLLKHRINQLEPELKKVIDGDLNLLWGVDDHALYNLQENMKSFFTLFATQRPENIAGFTELVKRFIDMPEWCMNMLGIKVVQSQEVTN